MLMVGDSTEDVECGNGAGTATCFIEEGGNEVAAAGALGGAVPTFTGETCEACSASAVVATGDAQCDTHAT